MFKKLSNHKLFFLGITIAISVAFLDLLSKRIVFAFLANLSSETSSSELAVLPFFNLVMVWNRGVSFGMFNKIENAEILLSLLQFSISLVLFFWLYKNKEKSISIALGLIIGGALGNLCDRINNGAVADFLDFHFLGYHWPAFNLADSFVFIGVMILIFEDIFLKKNADKNI